MLPCRVSSGPTRDAPRRTSTAAPARRARACSRRRRCRGPLGRARCGAAATGPPRCAASRRAPPTSSSLQRVNTGSGSTTHDDGAQRAHRGAHREVAVLVPRAERVARVEVAPARDLRRGGSRREEVAHEEAACEGRVRGKFEVEVAQARDEFGLHRAVDGAVEPLVHGGCEEFVLLAERDDLRDLGTVRGSIWTHNFPSWCSSSMACSVLSHGVARSGAWRYSTRILAPLSALMLFCTAALSFAGE